MPCAWAAASSRRCALPAERTVLWVELLSRQGEVLSRHRAEMGSEVRIGRGYDNDVIIDDSYVAAHHLRLVREEGGGLVAEDLGTANGLYIGEEKRPSARVAL